MKLSRSSTAVILTLLYGASAPKVKTIIFLFPWLVIAGLSGPYKNSLLDLESLFKWVSGKKEL